MVGETIRLLPMVVGVDSGPCDFAQGDDGEGAQGDDGEGFGTVIPCVVTESRHAVIHNNRVCPW